MRRVYISDRRTFPVNLPAAFSAKISPLIRVSRRAMATTFEVALPYGTPDALAAAEDALDLIDALEDQLTVYRDHSEVSRLNAAAPAGRPVVVEPNLFDLLTFAAALTNDTAGAFDIDSSGPAGPDAIRVHSAAGESEATNASS